MEYRVRAVLFDIMAGCEELKRSLQNAGIQVGVPFLGFQAKTGLQRELARLCRKGEECLLLTNQEEHARIGRECGLVVVGCIEGHFSAPKTKVLLESPEEVNVGYLDRTFCHSKGYPAVILETERLLLKEQEESEIETLYEILKETEGQRLSMKTSENREELEKLFSYGTCVYSFFEYGYWVIISKETGKLIGRAGFLEGSYPPEIGYVIEHSQWGKGYATETVKALLQYASEEIACECILARVSKKNVVSAHIAEKCGFVLSGEIGNEENASDSIMIYKFDM